METHVLLTCFRSNCMCIHVLNLHVICTDIIILPCLKRIILIGILIISPVISLQVQYESRSVWRDKRHRDVVQISSNMGEQSHDSPFTGILRVKLRYHRKTFAEWGWQMELEWTNPFAGHSPPPKAWGGTARWSQWFFGIIIGEAITDVKSAVITFAIVVKSSSCTKTNKFRWGIIRWSLQRHCKFTSHLCLWIYATNCHHTIAKRRRIGVASHEAHEEAKDMRRQVK